MKETFSLYFDGDFDGISSATAFLYFINKKYPESYKFNFEALGYKPDYKEWWPNKKLDSPSAVFDFRYHKDADWWFDHHKTSFLSEDDKQHFEKTEGNHQKVWDPDAKSCCGLLVRHISRQFNFTFPERILSLAKWTDVTDSAGFSSLEE